jgi:sec-independent protein translocase protein TatA
VGGYPQPTSRATRRPFLLRGGRRLAPTTGTTAAGTAERERREREGARMPDWVIVGVIAVVVLFGASKLPEIARNLGRSSGEFKKGLKEGADKPPPSETATEAMPAPSTGPAAETPSDQPRSEPS